MRVKLRVLEGSEKSLEIPLKGPKFFVGRDKSCHLRPHSDLISRHHCVFLLDSNSLAVRDFGSKNGTLVNGRRVVDRQQLVAGDELTIGPLKFEVVVEQPVRAAGRASSDDDSTHIENDIDSWLQEPDEPVDKSLGDTHVMRAEDAAFSDTKINSQSEEREAAGEQRADAAQSKPAPSPKAAAAGKSATSKTQDAAIDMLRQLNKKMRDRREGDDSKG